MSDKTVLTDEQKAKFVADICDYGTDFVTPLFAVIDNIEHAVLAASEDRRDAERYRWIRSEARNQWDGETAIDVIEAGGRRMDAVIDAAIAAAGKQVEG